MHRHKKISKLFGQDVLIWGISCALALSLPVFAQDEESSANLDRIQVTGSRISRTTVEGPTPVLRITRDDFEEQGYLTVQDVLDSLTQNTGGSISQQFIFGFTPGASAVNLRGFGSGRTLVLVDGRRIPVYPLGIGGTTQFFDTASIPTAIIERIEVLTDGASAIYGSDAIGGVVNIITRKDYDGFATRLRYGDTQDGGYQTNQVELIGGATGEKASSYIVFQYMANEELLAKQRDFTASDIGDPLGRSVYSTFGSNIVELFNGITVTPAPNCGQSNGPLGGAGIAPGTPGSGSLFGTSPCGFNRTEFRQLFPENDRATISGRVDYAISDTLNLFAYGRYTKSDTRTQIEPFAYSGTALFGGGAANPIVPNMGGLITGPNGGPAVYVRRLLEYGPRSSAIDTEFYGATVGLSGLLDNNWDWELAYSFNRQEVFSRRSGSIIMSAFENAVDNGLDLFQPIPASVVAATSFNPFTDAESDSSFFDFQISGFLPLELKGGPIGLAGVVEYEDQSFLDDRDPITLLGDASDGGSAGGGSRTRTAVGIETSLPVLETLEINLAARWDDYDDQSTTGSAMTPKIALQWRPTQSLLVRGSWGETFRAPDLQRLFGSTTRAFQTVNDTVVCQALGGTVGTALPSSVFNGPNNPYGMGFDPCVQTVQSVPTFTGSNPLLQEEEGESINIGVVWEIRDNLSASIDFYDVELQNIIAAPGGQFILNQCAAGNQAFCALVTRDAVGTLNGGTISATARNLSLQTVKGADLNVDYTLDVDSGLWKFNWGTTYVDEVQTQFAASQPVTAGVGIFSLPEWRSNLTGSWERDRFGATLRANYVGALGGLNSSIPLTSAQEIDDYLTFNGQFRFHTERFGNFRFGINNLLNEDPPVDPTNPQFPWYINAGGYYSPFGREYYIEWSKHWQ